MPKCLFTNRFLSFDPGLGLSPLALFEIFDFEQWNNN
jgi:hypothetical protein